MSNAQRRDTYDHLARELWSFAAELALAAVCTALRDEEVELRGEEASLETARAWLEAFRLVEASLGGPATLMDVRHLLFPIKGGDKARRHGDVAVRVSVLAEKFEAQYAEDQAAFAVPDAFETPPYLREWIMRHWIKRLKEAAEFIHAEEWKAAAELVTSSQEGPE